MARVGDEAALPLEPVLEPPEHLVQRPAEPCDLVVRGRDRAAARPSEDAEISAARRRIDSIGRSAAPASM